MPWPLDNPLVCAAAQVESNEAPKHAPPTKLDTIKKLEGMAVNVEISPIKRARASGLLLMTYTRLMFSDVQRLRCLGGNKGSIYGALLQSKTRRPHGLPRHWACPRMGASGSTEWAARILDFHNAREKLNWSKPSFVSPRVNTDGDWESGPRTLRNYTTEVSPNAHRPQRPRRGDLYLTLAHELSCLPRRRK